jgi:hypothetical protein
LVLPQVQEIKIGQEESFHFSKVKEKTK